MTNSGKVQAFFLIDLSDPYIINHLKIRDRFHKFLEKIDTHPKTSNKVVCMMIGLGTATQLVTTQDSWKRLGCDLNRGLQQVIQHCPVNDELVELFILLQNEPHEFDETLIEQLQTAAKVTITLFDVGQVSIKQETIQKIIGSKPSYKLSKVALENFQKAFEEIFLQLVQATGRLMALPPPPETAPTADELPLPPFPQLPAAIEETVVSEPTSSGDAMTSPDIPNSDQSPADSIPVKPAPLANSQGIAQVWQTIDPPADIDYYRVPHTATDHRESEADWHLLAASRRGKLHAHKGSFREDAFALGSANGWHLVVVADGGGSCSLSRAGSKIAATTAIETMKNTVMDKDFADFTEEQLAETGKKALQRGVQEAWYALQAEAEKMTTPLKEFGTTYLAMIHYPQGPNGHLVGVLQVGDGVVAMELVDGTIKVLADPDVGQSASVTLFLTSKRWDEWLSRVKVYQLPMPPRLLAAMCDGVGDDFIPYDKLLPNLFKGLNNQVITADDPEAMLLKALEYEKRGSFDDRTLALIYHLQPEKLESRVGELTELLDASLTDEPTELLDPPSPDEATELFESAPPDEPPESLEPTRRITRPDSTLRAPKQSDVSEPPTPQED